MIRALFFLVFVLAAFTRASAQAPAESKDTVTTFSGLKYVAIREGSGEQAYAHRKVTIQYIGRFLTILSVESQKNEFFV